MIKLLILSILSAGYLTSCTHEQNAPDRKVASALDGVSTRFDLPLRSDLGEKLVENEQSSVEKLFGLMKGHMENHYSGPVHAFRAVHATGTGCVKGKFIVAQNIDPELQFGVFSPGHSYDAFVRFSNGDGPPENDAQLESRGMAIKLLNVDRPKILNEKDPYNSQDFLMADQPRFFLPDVTAYALAIAAGEGNVVDNAKFLGRFGLDLPYRLTATPILNPLNAFYWSKTPYQLGPVTVVKFRAKPCVDLPMKPVPYLQNNYMAKELSDQVAAQDTCFEFALQKRTKNGNRDTVMPIEDASVRWDESLSPFVKVAELRIEKGQDVNSDFTRKFCENLSFNPWHAVQDERPLGSLNRVRKVVYEVSSKFRLDHNR